MGPIPEGKIQELYLSDRELSDDRLIAEAIHVAIKRHLPKKDHPVGDAISV
jgi:hypothetical protein